MGCEDAAPAPALEVSVVFWVIVASKHGSSREVADAIADALNGVHEVEVFDPGGVGDLAGADAIVLGSAIYGGRWLQPARELVGERAQELASRPLWLFSCGPLGDPPKPEDAGPDGIAETVAATRAREHKVFAGKLDYSKLGRIERLMVRALHAPEGDFRDWDAIHGWARAIAAEDV